MRRTSIGSRWHTPGQRYAGGWRQNPWINAMCSALHARSATESSSAADREAAGQPGSVTSQHNDGNLDRQQRAAVRTWENEGGSLGAHPSMSR